MIVAPNTAATSQVRSPYCFLPTILSSTILGAYGGTTLILILINMRKKPSASLPRRGHTNSINRGRAPRKVSDAFFFLGMAGDTAYSLQREASSYELRD